MPGPDAGGDDAGAVPSDQPRLVVVTTDFATGAISEVSPSERTVRRDVALASPDAIPYVHDGLVYVVNRFMYDYVDVYDPDDDWALVAEHAIDPDPDGVGTTPSTNPQAVAFSEGGLAFVTLYGASEVQVHDFSRPSEMQSLVGRVSTMPLADADGIAETTLAIGHGNEIWVAVSRVDRSAGWQPVATDELVLIDAAADPPVLVDLDPDAAGVQGLTLPSISTHQFRRDPNDPSRVYLLGSVVLAVDLDARAVETIVDEAQLAQAGIEDHLLNQSFDVSSDGETLYLAAYLPDFSGVDIFEVPAAGGVPESIVTGLNAVERTLEVVGDEIWFGDTTVGASGMRAFDTRGQALLDAPLSTGLDPYAIVELTLAP